jgi:hypothetical protein
LRRYIKYSRKYRLAIACFAAAAVVTAAIAIVAATVFTPGVLLSNVLAGSSLFFVPTIAGVALMMGLSYWFSAESRRNTFFVEDKQ